MEAELEAEPTQPWEGGIELSLAEHKQRRVQPCSHAAMQPASQASQPASQPAKAALEASGQGDKRG